MVDKNNEFLEMMLPESHQIIAAENCKSTIFPPHSMAFVGHYDIEYRKPGRIGLWIVVVRVGKGGKKRIEYNRIMIPMFFDNRISKELTSIFRPYPRNFADIKLYSNTVPFNVLDYALLEKLAWCASRIIKLKFIAMNYGKAQSRQMFWRDQSSLIYSVHRLVRKKSFGRIPEELKSSWENTIPNLIKEIRIKESELMIPILLYLIRKTSIKKRGIEFINSVVLRKKEEEGTFRTAIPKKTLKEKTKEIDEELARLEALLKIKRGSKN